MEIRPILSAMLRNRAGTLLVGLQIAITLAVVANAAFIIQQRLEKIGRPTGIDTPNIFYLYSYGYAPGYDGKATLARDQDTLRRIPGVIATTSINSMILSGGGSANSFLATPDPKAPNIPGNFFEIGARGLDALGVRLIEGRNFRPEEVLYSGISNAFPKVVIVSQTMARAVFGTEHEVSVRTAIACDTSFRYTSNCACDTIRSRPGPAGSRSRARWAAASVRTAST